MRIQIKQTAQFYANLGDELSKRIFEARLMYSLTRDNKYIRRIVDEIPEKERINELIKLTQRYSDKLVIYGAGNEFSYHYDENNGLAFKAICDRNTDLHKHGWRGHKVISPKELIESYRDYFIAILVSSSNKEIYRFLVKNGISQKRIINIGDVAYNLYLNQYFDNDIFQPEDGEVFIDGGSFDGNTTLTFRNWCDNTYERIIAFEADKYNYNKCISRKEMQYTENTEIINKGLWHKRSVLPFDSNKDQSSKIIAGSSDKILDEIETTSIDEYLQGDKATFIKLDVEGAELKALEGAKNTILRYHPKLAISLYHKPEDIFDIPNFIISLSDRYRFYLRHYQMSACETILYAVETT